MAVFRGIAGIVCREDRIEINPHMMPWWDGVKFSFFYRGAKISVEMTGEEYKLSSDSETPIKVVFRGKELEVSKAHVLAEKM